MTFSRLAMALAAATLVSAPVAAEAATRASAVRSAVVVKKAHRAAPLGTGFGMPGFVWALPALVVVPTFIVVESSKSNGI